MSPGPRIRAALALAVSIGALGCVEDGGSPDAGSADTGGLDAGDPDAGRVDAGGADAGPGDAGLGVDAGPADAGARDAGDAGTPPPPGTLEFYVSSECEALDPVEFPEHEGRVGTVFRVPGYDPRRPASITVTWCLRELDGPFTRPRPCQTYNNNYWAYPGKILTWCAETVYLTMMR